LRPLDGAEVTIDIAQHHSLLISLSINWCDQSLDLARKKTSDRSIALDQSIARGNSENNHALFHDAIE
jgi:hypothetical protein